MFGKLSTYPWTGLVADARLFFRYIMFNIQKRAIKKYIDILFKITNMTINTKHTYFGMSYDYNIRKKKIYFTPAKKTSVCVCLV